MAAEDIAARRYAQAAYEIAIATRDADAWIGYLRRIADFVADKEVADVLQNTRVTEEAKHSLINAALGDLPKLVLNLAHVLVQKDRTALAPAIAEQFAAMMEEHEGIARARAITAVPLSPEEQERLVQQLGAQTGRRIVLETAVDPDILGGIIVQIGDRLIDGSTRSRLQALKREMVGALE